MMLAPATFATALPPDVAVLFRAEELPTPVLPRGVDFDLQPEGPFAWASPTWPAGDTLQEWAQDWLERPDPPRAWIGLTGHGLQSTAVRVCIATPSLAIFIVRRWTEALDQGPILRRRIEGAFGLSAQLLHDASEAQRAQAWPANQRLLLIDDDFDSQRWAWLAPGEGLDALQVDAMAYISALADIDALRSAAVA
ncbi:hypothetical protein JI739_02205 [Ramlibacter sp. AW1]|uniref:Uncharacterized protein n=1 Tax=Ramlibacter aurantiacus TaxID=2801330 RepID=A0A937D1V4_9BURK|nr:hypothetical protein [Ramlibacter aurantiacus]MBL0419150.1 hypothetical protein [Ramlibacter aurantiacus]